MGAMNFTVPDDVQKAFDDAFDGENKNAVVANLLRRAAEERKRTARSGAELDALIEDLIRQRDEDEPMSDEDIRRIRQEGRP